MRTHHACPGRDWATRPIRNAVRPAKCRIEWSVAPQGIR
jgi:hypothetical protein